MDQATRFIEVTLNIVEPATGLWIRPRLVFEFTTPGKVYALFSPTVGKENSPADILTFKQLHNPSNPLANSLTSKSEFAVLPSDLSRLCFLVSTFTVYYITTFAVRCWERGSAFKVLSRDMVLMDIVVQTFTILSLAVHISSAFNFPNLKYVDSVTGAYGGYGFAGRFWPIGETCDLWQVS